MPRRHEVERDIQVNFMAFTEWQGLLNPELLLFFSIPMGGQRNEIVGKKLKIEGAKAGVPDLFLPVARKNRHGLFIEFKAPGKKPRANQIKWIKDLREQDYAVFVCWSMPEAVCLCAWYLDLEIDDSFMFNLQFLEDSRIQLIKNQFKENNIEYPY